MAEAVELKEVVETPKETPKEKPEVVETPSKYTPEQTEAYIIGLRKENEKYRKDSAKKLEDEKEARKLELEEKGKFKELYEQSLKDAEVSKLNLSETEKKNALALALRDAEAINPELLGSLFKTDGKFNFELLDGKIVGWDNIINPIKEKYAPQFGKEVIKGADPKRGNTAPDFYTEQELSLLTPKDWVDNLDKAKASVVHLK
jgi:hypothetical protein